jgi:integrase/recombinase XerD
MNDIQSTKADFDMILSTVNKHYRGEAIRFITLVKEKGFSPDVMEMNVSNLKDEGKSASTVNKHISAMRAVVRKIYESPHLTAIQSWEIEKALEKIRFVKKAGRSVPEDKIITPDEMDALMAGSSERLSLIMTFLWNTGLRISEALGIKYEDCRQTGDVITIRVLGKGNKEREIRISASFYEKIREEFRGEKYLFESSQTKGNALHDRNVDKEIRRIGKRILRRTLSPHMFRHSFATRMIASTGKIKGVSQYLGHSTTAITMDLYVHERMNNTDLGI